MTSGKYNKDFLTGDTIKIKKPIALVISTSLLSSSDFINTIQSNQGKDLIYPLHNIHTSNQSELGSIKHNFQFLKHH